MQRILSRAFPSTSSNVSATTSHFIVDRRPPPDLGKWANFKRFIWNKEKRMVCNRTCASWCKIICFYMIFLIVMLGTFFLLMLGCTEYIRENYKLPWIEKKSLIEEGNPGVGFIPNIIKTTSPLIWYTLKGSQAFDNMKYGPYVDYLTRYFKTYDEAEKNKHNYSNCESSKEQHKPCIFLRKDLGPCGIGEFGYPDKKPCIYIKINKLPEWVPEYYTGNDLPEEMPQSLKTAIKADSNRKKLWVHCDGVYPPDTDHIGRVSYYPHQGIMGYFFPYDGNKHYLTPLVAVKVDNVKKGYAINIRCSVWAKNIRYSDPRTHSAYIQMYLAMD